MKTLQAVTRWSGTVLSTATLAILALPGAAQANNDVVALKHALYGAGYEITNVSPSMDEATRAELSQFQQDNGLQATGILNEETEKALGMITVQQAAANAGQTATVPAAPAAAAEPAEATAPEEAIEEDEDGGWSLW